MINTVFSNRKDFNIIYLVSSTRTNHPSLQIIIQKHSDSILYKHAKVFNMDKLRNPLIRNL